MEIQPAHVFEPASTGRSKCRGCKQPLAKGELRFGEALPNQFGEGEVTHWFHPRCAAYRRPEPLLQALAAFPQTPDREALEGVANKALFNQRLTRIDGGERAPSSQAHCRQCKEPIEKGAWRIRLIFQEEGTFTPGGFIHVGCSKDYFGAGDVLEQVLQFSPALAAPDRDALVAAVTPSGTPAP
jgi:hypothetical protein